jgi:hypothetical protein
VDFGIGTLPVSLLIAVDDDDDDNELFQRRREAAAWLCPSDEACQAGLVPSGGMTRVYSANHLRHKHVS